MPVRIKVPANKFGAISTTVDGIRFASRAEAKRYGELCILQKAGLISDLKCQPRYELSVNGVRVCEYIADFSYIERGKGVVEDVKSPATRTPVYLLKKKLMKAIHGLEVVEVTRS